MFDEDAGQTGGISFYYVEQAVGDMQFGQNFFANSFIRFSCSELVSEMQGDDAESAKPNNWDWIHIDIFG